jgi:sialidase-1
MNTRKKQYGKRFFYSLWLLILIWGCATQSTGKELKAKIISTKIICQQADRYIGWPTIALTKDKELIAVFSGDRDAHVCPWGKTQMVKSTNNGTTWSAPVTINNSPLDDRDAGIMQTNRGALIASWFTSIYFIYVVTENKTNYPLEMKNSWLRHIDKISPETQNEWLGNWIRRSTDGGKTWGKNINTIVNAPHGPIQLTDGRLLYLGINGIIGDKNRKHPPDDQRIAAAESLDDGLTWEIIGYVPVPNYLDPGAKAFHELHAVETVDGKIVAMIRHHGKPGNKYLWQTESNDGGRTWTEAHQTDIWGYPPHLIRLKNNWLLVSYGHRKEPFSERACISRDGGKTWDVHNEFTISNAINSDLGYPASVQLDDASIYTVYYQIAKPNEKTCLMGTHWRIEEK